MYSLPLDKVAEGVNRIGGALASQSCSINSAIPWVLYIVLAILVIKYKELIMIKVLKLYTKKGYIRVIMRLKNMHLQPILVKLDVMNNFKHKLLKDKMYTLNNMHDYIIGYDTHGFPTFFYDEEFILPWKVTTVSVNDKIKEDLQISDNTQVKAIAMRISASTLRLVYDKKLMSDIYNAAGSGLNWKWLLIIGAAAVVGYMVYTGQAKKEFILPFMPIIKTLGDGYVNSKTEKR